MSQDVIDQLSPDLYSIDEDVLERHSVDWSAEQACRPDVVLRPRTTADVARMLALCHAAGQPVVVQGGLTGLAGGATPQPGELALSLARMNRIVELDTAGMTLTAGAGTPLQTLQEAADAAGCRFPLDLGARGSCLAGGFVATNAGGNQVIQFGMTRAFVLGLVAVLADGTTIPARNRLLKNNAGFDLKQLFIGSEGALGVVTEVTFRLFPKKPARQTALCAVASFDAVIELLQRMGRELEALSSFEVMWADYYENAIRAAGSPDPLGGAYPFYVLVETEGANAEATAEIFQAALFGSMEDGLVADAAIAQSTTDAAAFWSIRDAIAELLREFDPCATFDIGIPIGSMDNFVLDVRRDFSAMFPDGRLMVFGHVGDGNLHLVATTGRAEDKDAVYDLVYRRTGELNGTITAEHGIGVLKKRWLSCCRSAEEIALMRTLKTALDPQGILNPGRVIQD